MQEYKKCNKCGEIKLKTCFHTDRKSNDNLVGSCKKCMSENDKKWYKENSERAKENSRKWRKENLERAKENQRKWKKEKRQTDISFKIECSLRVRANRALNGEDKSASTRELIGADPEFVKKHLESQFEEGMSWDNNTSDGWHKDHIIPCASFDLSDPEQQKKCFHWSNLQPLWAKDNLSKGAKLNWRK